MSNKLKSLFYSKLELVLILGLASLFLLVGLTIPKSIAKGDVTQSDTSGTWFGNLGPAAVGSAGSDVDTKSAQIGISYNSTLSQYEATQTANGSYFIRSKVIAPASGTLKKWKQLKLGLRRPANTNTAITVDILCGDPLQPPQCGTLYQPIVGYTNIPLSANDDYDIPQSLAAIKIMIRVNFSSVDVLQPQIALYNWQVSWLVNSGVNLTVSKTPNPANPEEQYPGSGPYPGVNNNNIVVYTLNYSLDTTVHGLTLELPVPVGVYTPSVGVPKTYTAAYIASSGGALSGNKVVWSLGDKLAGTVGTVSATFKIQTGPPNGTVFKTNPLIWGTDYNLSKTPLPDDLLNIQSWGFAQSYVVAPQYVAPNTEVGYVVRLNAIYYYFQSDIFNSHYEFNYSTCLDNTDTNYPKVYGSGLASWSVDRPNRKIILNMNSPVTAMLNMDYTVTLKASPSCGLATVGGTLTLVSDLDIDKSIKAQKVSNVTWDGLNPSNWDSTSTPRVSVGKSTWSDPTGAGARVDYSLRFDQQSTVPATNFYAIDQIPAQTTFISANFYSGLRAITGGIVNNWKIYWSNSVAQPPQNDVSWTQLQWGSVPCSSSCTVPAGQEGSVKWLKWEVGSANSFLWDRQDNFDQPLGSLSVVTNPTVTGTIANTIQSYANNVCQLGCSASRTISSDNKPYFETAYGQSANTSCASYPGGSGSIVVQSGASYCAQSIIANSNGSHGDATDVYYTMRLPDRDYLDPSYNPMSLSSSEAHALCLLNGPYSSTCPDQNGVSQNNPVWLQPESANCSGATGPCTVTWHIRKIYSAFSYPAKVPFQYAFWIQVKTKPGLFDQQEICRGSCTSYSITTTPANANTNFPIANTNTVTISASVTTHITNVGSPTLDCSQTAPNGLATYTMTYDPTGSTGNIANLYVMNALPEVGPPTVNPPVRLIYNAESHVNAPNMTVWYLLNYQRNGNPPSSNTSGSGPGWVLSVTPAQWPTVDWVMWKKTAPLAYNAAPESVTLTLTDQSSCSPNKTQYIDRGFVSYDSNSSSPTVANATTLIANPGFITTSRGNIGSNATQSGINFPIKVVPSSPAISLIGLPQTAMGNGVVSTLSWTHNVDGRFPYNVLVVAVSLRGSAPVASVTGVTFNGASFTQAIRQTDGGGIGAEIWYLLAPASGSRTVTVNMSGLVGIVAGSSQFDFVDQTTPIGTALGAQVWGTTPSVAVNTSSGDVVVDVLSKPDGGAGTANPDPSQTKLWSNVEVNAAVRGGSSYKNGSGATTMLWNVNWENNIIAAVPLKLYINPPPPPSSNWSKVDYLAISQGTIQNLQSLKNWLVTSYSGGLPNPFNVSSSSYPNYDTMFADYSRDAKPCTNDASCLAGGTDTDKVKLFQPSSSNPALVINSTSTYSTVPRIIFVPAPFSGSDALVMNTNFSITANSGIIFVVKGNVSVNYGVTNIAGVFLVDGKFSTGTRSSTNTTGIAAGEFATISTGQDGFARIAYLSGDNVRLIKCNDLDCQNRDYGYVTSVVGTSVTSISMALYPASVNVDYPQIVISQNDTKYTTKFINCSSQDCLSSNTITYQDAKDSAIVYNNAKISFVLGSGGSAPRSATIYQCPDQACLSPAVFQIDGGVSGQDKGNDLNISTDSTGTLVVTYVDRSTGTPNKSDLWIARYNSVNSGTGCSPATITNWDCRRISPASPGNVGVFPSSTTDLATNLTKNIYTDSSNRLNYLGCTNVTCTTTTASIVDCGSGTCSAQVYGSIKIGANGSHALYNTINTGSLYKEVKLAYCTTTCLSWPNIFNMTNNPTFSVRNADIYNQGLAYGTGPEAGMPRIVFYNEDDKSLYYIHCKVVSCEPSTPANVVYKKIDDGVAIALKDTQLTISGSIIAFGNGVTSPSAGKAIYLQRDLFNASTTNPGEIINLDPKYFYILKDVIKTPKDIINESPP